MRFIPAHAGNSASQLTTGAATTVHPRACGEQCRRLLADSSDVGSSPRMRGTDLGPSRIVPCHRFIPAHAGNRSFAFITSTPRSVHPRACGEQIRKKDAAQFSDGSSPRMRGTALVFVPAWMGRRFIPAHAGNRPNLAIPRSSPTVHPRACGEQPIRDENLKQHGGSSPRMRGTGLLGGDRRKISRFIPAHAGNR